MLSSLSLLEAEHIPTPSSLTSYNCFCTCCIPGGLSAEVYRPPPALSTNTGEQEHPYVAVFAVTGGEHFIHMLLTAE